MNLLDVIKNYLTPELISQVSKLIGEDNEKTGKALKSVLPVVLGGLATKTSEPIGAGQLVTLLQNGGHDGRLLTNLSESLSNKESASGILEAGSGIISSLFGTKGGAIASAISTVSGVKSSSVTSLMNLVAPIVMGAVGKEATAHGGLTASGLTSLLASQKDSILSALPAGLGTLLGGSLGLGSLAGGFSNLSSGFGGNENGNNSGGGLPKWLLPVLIGLGIIGFALYMMKGCGNKVKDDAMATIDSTANLAGSTVNGAMGAVDSAANAVEGAASGVASAAGTAVDAVKKMFKLKLPNGSEIEVPEGSLEDQIVKFIQDKDKAVDKTLWFNFDRLLFDTGKTTLKPASMEQVEKTIAILNAFPSVKIKIGGYTDNKGDAKANMKLSADRANVVMNALIKGGIDKARLAAEGYGDQHPVASNDTEEGRSQNRRIAIRVTEK